METAQIVEGSFTGRRGVRIFTLELKPSGKAVGVLLFHHGFGEHGGRHLNVLKELCVRCRLVVVSFDAHGHGRSEPFEEALRAYVADYRHLLHNTLDMLDEVVVPRAKELAGELQPAVFVGGHSMGGLISLLLATERPAVITGVLVSSPYLSVAPVQTWALWAQIAALRLLNLLAPTRPFLKRRTVEAGLRDPAGVKECYEDTLWYRGPIKVGTIVSCIDGSQVLQAKAKQVRCPCYLQQGTHDLTCSVITMRQFLAKLASTEVRYHEVEGGFHDLSHDPETPTCINNMVVFINDLLERRKPCQRAGAA